MVLPYRHSWTALWAGLAIGLAALALCYVAGFDEPLRQATQLTGRISAVLFLPVFAARPLVDLFGPARFGGLLRHRSGFGVAMAGNHHVHMVVLTVLLVGEGNGAATFFLNPGLYIYGLIIVMNVTSFPSMAKRFGRRATDWLHWIGIYAISAAFLKTLTLSLLTGEDDGAFRIGWSIVFGLCVLLRVAAAWQGRARAAAE